MGIENVRHADTDLNTQKENLNQYIMVNFNGITDRIKRVLGGEKLRIETAIDEFNKAEPLKEPKNEKVDLFKKKPAEYMTNYQDLYNSINRFIVNNDDQRRAMMRTKMAQKPFEKYTEDRGYDQHYVEI